MSTHVVNEFHAKPGRGDGALAMLLQLAPASGTRPGCEVISIRRNQDDREAIASATALGAIAIAAIRLAARDRW